MLKLAEGITSVSSEVAGTKIIMHLSGTFVTRNFNIVCKEIKLLVFQTFFAVADGFALVALTY